MWREVVNVPVAFRIVVEHMPFRLVRVGGETFAGLVPHAVVGTATAIGLRRDTLNVIKSIKFVKLYSTFYISHTIRTNGLLYLIGHNECPLLTILQT